MGLNTCNLPRLKEAAQQGSSKTWKISENTPTMKVFVILSCVLLVTLASPKQQILDDSDSRTKGEYQSIAPEEFYENGYARRSFFDHSYRQPFYDDVPVAPYFAPYPLIPQFRRYVRPINPTDGSLDDRSALRELDLLRNHFYPPNILASADVAEQRILTKLAIKAIALQLLVNPSGFVHHLNTLGSSLAKLYYTETAVPIPFLPNKGILLPVLTTTR